MYVVLENMMDNDLLHLTWTIPYISSDTNKYIHCILAKTNSRSYWI